MRRLFSAALLHDTIEDCQGITREVLAQEFSERVAALVAQESEDKSKTWFERKSHTIEHLKYAPYEVRIDGLADKLLISVISTGIIRSWEKSCGIVSE